MIERILVIAGVAALSSSAPAPSLPLKLAPQASEETEATCCFNNPAYAGTCKVQPAEDETCESILEYLNNPMAQGKNYCGGTKVRQGWKQVACDEEAC